MTEPGLSAILEISAPITYIALLIFCGVLALLKPEHPHFSPSAIDLTTHNLRIWGFAAGVIGFLILLILHQMNVIEASPIDYIGGRLLLGGVVGFIAGVALLEGARLTNLSTFAALFIAFVVAGSLSSLYVFIVFEDIRAVLVLATMFFLLGIILDFIVRNGLKAMLDREYTVEAGEDEWK